VRASGIKRIDGAPHVVFVCKWAHREDFAKITMSSTMLTDHLPDKVRRPAEPRPPCVGSQCVLNRRVASVWWGAVRVCVCVRAPNQLSTILRDLAREYPSDEPGAGPAGAEGAPFPQVPQSPISLHVQPTTRVAGAGGHVPHLLESDLARRGAPDDIV